MEKELVTSLVARAQSGDQTALNELFNACYADIHYFVLKTVKNEDLALDVTQETFVEIVNTLQNLREPAAFISWSRRIAYHQCTRYFKKKKDVLVDEDEDGNTVFDTLQEENTEFIPDEALDQADFKSTILAMLDELSEEQRSAVMLYYFDELSIKQIADIQGVSEGTIKSRLNYARKAMKQSVEDYEKKHGIKLHALPFLPLLKWVWGPASESSAAAAAAPLVAEGVTAATGATITASSVTAATAVGLGAKLVALPLAVKMIAGIAAAAILAGGSALLLSNIQPSDTATIGNPIGTTTSVTETTTVGNGETVATDVNDTTTSPSEQSGSTTESGATTTADVGNGTSATTKATTKATTTTAYANVGLTDAKLKTMLETEFNERIYPAIFFSFSPYFGSVDRLSPSAAFWFCRYYMRDALSDYAVSGAQYTHRIPVSVLDEITQQCFGCTYDYSALKNNFDPAIRANTVSYAAATSTYPVDHLQLTNNIDSWGESRHAKVKEIVKVSDQTFQINISWYDGYYYQKPTDPNADWYEDDGCYYTAYQWDQLVCTYVNGNWQIVSYRGNR